jgi:DNA repair protein RecO (recombination protein O)
VALVSTGALVLQTFPYSETSKVLRLYTREHGLRSVIAKGALRPKSRFGGLLEPFTEGTATFYMREGRDLHTLSGWDLVRARQALGRSLSAFAGGSLLGEVVLRASTEEAHPEIYSALAEAWDGIAAAPTATGAERAVLAGAWKLVSLLGFEPQTDACVACGRPVAPDDPVRFDSLAGGVACTRCRPVGRILDPATRADVARMSRGHVPSSLERPGAHRALLRAFLDAQLAHDRPFRSMDLFLESHRDTEAQR